MGKKEECKHVLNHSETHCTICMKPTWQIAHDTGLDKIDIINEWINCVFDLVKNWKKNLVNLSYDLLK